MLRRRPSGLLSVIGAVWLVGSCQRPNPAYRFADGSVGDDTAVASGGVTGSGGDGTGGDGGSIGAGGAGTGGAGTGGIGGVDASADLATDVVPDLAADLAADLATDLATDRGPDMTGACTDGDGDGYGVGAGCLGPDCNDADPQANLTATRACYTGLARTKDVGVCRSGTETCAAGVWSACNGQVLPSGETCNGEDDDCSGLPDDALGMIACGLGACAKQVAACASALPGVCTPAAPSATTDGCDGIDNDCDGATDEDCLTACVRVAPSGSDNGADGSTVPFRNIQDAIAWAAMPDHAAKTVCVAGGGTCQDQATYKSPDATRALVMSNGISVLGNFESTTWTRCPLTLAQLVSPGPNVRIEATTPTGVEFPRAVIAPTVLDGVAILRLQSGGNIAVSAAVTVDGAKQVTLSHLAITDAPVAASSYGINLINGAEATITRSLVFAGAGTVEAVAIRSVASRPIVRDNCGSIDPNTGRCTTVSCATTNLALRGRNGGTASPQGSAATILLRDSPGAIVERNTICGGPATQLAGVHVTGPAAGTILRGNAILVAGGVTDAHGVWFDACGDAAPLVVDNELIQADAAPDGIASAVRATGACHPVIAGNAKLSGGGETALEGALGVWCGASGGTASRCAILGNKLIQGATSNRPLRSVAVACEAGACVRVARNTLAGNGGVDVMGLYVDSSSPLVERNTITGGCGDTMTGVFAVDSGSRIENNVIRGAAVCPDSASAAIVRGMHVHVAPGAREVDIHSNTVDAGGAGFCTGTAISFGTSTTAAAMTVSTRGIFRNNIFQPGACSTARYHFWGDTPPTRPRVLQNNDFDPNGARTAMYLDGTSPLLSVLEINALTRTMAAANISVLPMFTAAPTDLHLGAMSACADSGTTVGAPARDFDGKMRDPKPDIGAFER